MNLKQIGAFVAAACLLVMLFAGGKVWAKAVSDYRGNWVPAINGNGSGQNGGNGAMTLIDLLSAKTAKELGVDLGIKPTK